ncbi:hypothetical protein GO013_12595 [Pseudodesulfovibrio sp. JC047]|uniref:hypothetical protein n=1 Tax=Pseudodesulfovibrio sp. JC047 TaxID=2683199 RepID=UPI0013D13A99|nr:hypothetical protein [Pseudodesulfovibrio sp. JC047]NDV20250.1 hypothetical protein [Pseudodesulfovibrio sp. JC047]
MEEKAFDSHSEAYSEGGLSKVTIPDLIKIASEVDAKDFWTKKAIKEAIEVAPDGFEAGVNDLKKRGNETARALKKKLNLLSDEARKKIDWLVE